MVGQKNSVIKLKYLWNQWSDLVEILNAQLCRFVGFDVATLKSKRMKKSWINFFYPNYPIIIANNHDDILPGYGK